MGAEKITSKILDDAKKKADEIISEAQKEADSILEKAKMDAEKRKQNILKKGEKEAEMAKNRIIADAKLSAKRKSLEERENILKMAIEKLEEDMLKLPQKESYKDILLKLIINGVISVGGGELTLHLNKRDFELIDDSTIWAIEKEMEEVLKKVTILKKGESVDIVGGCIIKTADQLKVCDNSLESVFDRNSEAIRAKIAEMLF
ncbi:MAG: V/A-type H+/Na+-transporting ATPase subunit [Methanothermococcus sp.]|uniref:V-type proton ATPase subunit E n=1 Tax=Methanothermococcus TaxID=155862 RepID=UPI00036E1032|nr:MULTISPECIES: V-type ATP synthase subunit E [Methanothermococcus]MDK2789984.1 V/A-type H+/Na+-transporting ATPase subunit [Methanothermococcus sp.]MDK2986887.1 V/A-type H+/Na+-transporting ATPase subunit [Methanothermococcus sp.]